MIFTFVFSSFIGRVSPDRAGARPYHVQLRITSFSHATPELTGSGQPEPLEGIPIHFPTGRSRLPRENRNTTRRRGRPRRNPNTTTFASLHRPCSFRG